MGCARVAQKSTRGSYPPISWYVHWHQSYSMCAAPNALTVLASNEVGHSVVHVQDGRSRITRAEANGSVCDSYGALPFAAVVQGEAEESVGVNEVRVQSDRCLEGMDRTFNLARKQLHHTDAEM